MDLKTILGLAAACCTTIAFVPQAFKTLKTKDTASISAKMYIIFTLGTIMWTVYGFWTANLPVILANIVTSILAILILYYKLTKSKQSAAR